MYILDLHLTRFFPACFRPCTPCTAVAVTTARSVTIANNLQSKAAMALVSFSSVAAFIDGREADGKRRENAFGLHRVANFFV